MFHSFFIHSSADGHLGQLPGPGSVNNTAVNIGCMYSFKSVTWRTQKGRGMESGRERGRGGYRVRVKDRGAGCGEGESLVAEGEDWRERDAGNLEPKATVSAFKVLSVQQGG